MIIPREASKITRNEESGVSLLVISYKVILLIVSGGGSLYTLASSE
jgi:hypothetical protein